MKQLCRSFIAFGAICFARIFIRRRYRVPRVALTVSFSVGGSARVDPLLQRLAVHATAATTHGAGVTIWASLR